MASNNKTVFLKKYTARTKEKVGKWESPLKGVIESGLREDRHDRSKQYIKEEELSTYGYEQVKREKVYFFLNTYFIHKK